MNAEYLKIRHALKSGQFAPFYLVDGEEPYYIDDITHHFEHDILPPHERDFNLQILYGKEVHWNDVLNACRRFPMFAERQVVILKDAASLKDLGELISYLEKPSPTTILLLEHRFKKADGKTKFVKVAKEKGVYFTSDKVREDAMPGWIKDFGRSINLSIGDKEAEVLTSFLGNDLQKIVNEIEKVRINIPDEPALTLAHIQKFIGVSRDYNIFDFPDVLTSGNEEKLYKMIYYFMSSPKAAPVVLLVTAFYSHFSKIYQANFLKGKPEAEVINALGKWKSREYMALTQQWPKERAERCLLILAKYSAMAVGIKSNADDKSLLKEMVMQLAMPY